MINILTNKFANAVIPVAIVNNTTIAATAVDTLGFDYATIVVQLGATDIALSAFKLTECDTSGGSYTDVTGAIFGTSVNDTGSTSTLPSATDDNKLFVFSVDCRARKRYLKLAATVGNGSTGAYMSAIAILSRGEQGTRTAAEANLSQRVIV